MSGLTISELFSEAAKKLRADFEYVRASNPHAGEKGSEVEEKLREFLNNHLPQRFRAASGIIIDAENKISRQTDVIIYDALASPVYRYGERSHILPMDTVAAVIEVKTVLNKAEITDAYEKIASCKSLKKTPLSVMDKKATGSGMSGIGTLGVVFGFDSDITLETLAEHVAELNARWDSKVWPDVVLVLDKGVINYCVALPGQPVMADLAPPSGDDFAIPPFYVHLAVRKDGTFSLNRFFAHLLAHLTFYPHRVSTPPFEVLMEGAAKEAMLLTPYQYDTNRRLRDVPSGMYRENEPKVKQVMRVRGSDGQTVGFMQFIPWQDGGVVRWRGLLPITVFIPILIPGDTTVITTGSDQFSGVLTLTASDFEKWPELLAKSTNMTAVFDTVPS